MFFLWHRECEDQDLCNPSWFDSNTIILCLDMASFQWRNGFTFFLSKLTVFWKKRVFCPSRFWQIPKWPTNLTQTNKMFSSCFFTKHYENPQKYDTPDTKHQEIVIVVFTHLKKSSFLTSTHFIQFFLTSINTKVMLLFHNPKRQMFVFLKGQKTKNLVFFEKDKTQPCLPVLNQGSLQGFFHLPDQSTGF